MSIKYYVRRAFNITSDFLYPPLCVSCKKPLFWKKHNLICTSCFESIEYIGDNSCWLCAKSLGKYAARQKSCDECKNKNHKFTRIVAACCYNDIAKDIIHAYKFQNSKNLHVFISEAIYMQFLKEYSNLNFDYIVPVPLHRNKKNERGYNQSALIAKNLSQRTNIEYSEKILVRTRDTLSQSMLNASDRKLNMSGAFFVKKSLEKQNILLVDDVFTTGTTINECSYTLRTAGARRVYAIVFAR